MKATVLFNLILIVTFSFIHCTETPNASAETKATSEVVPSQADLIKRGEYLVQTMGCNDCHSPKIMTPKGPAPDPDRLLSGHPADQELPAIANPEILKDYALFNLSLTASVGPWGTSFAANLTPDDTGLGNWTLEQFGKALKEGKSKGMDGTRPLLPPMPWQNLVNISDDDLTAMFAYLQSIPPVNNAVPNPLPPVGM